MWGPGKKTLGGIGSLLCWCAVCTGTPSQNTTVFLLNQKVKFPRKALLCRRACDLFLFPISTSLETAFLQRFLILVAFQREWAQGSPRTHKAAPSCSRGTCCSHSSLAHTNCTWIFPSNCSSTRASLLRFPVGKWQSSVGCFVKRRSLPGWLSQAGPWGRYVLCNNYGTWSLLILALERKWLTLQINWTWKTVWLMQSPYLHTGLSFRRKWLLKDFDSPLLFYSTSLIGRGHPDPLEECLCLTGASPTPASPFTKTWSSVTNNRYPLSLPPLIPFSQSPC